MFEYYSVKGEVQQVNDAQASQMMNSISSQWEDEQTPFGKLYFGVYDWDYITTKNRTEILFPNLRGGGVYTIE